MNKTKSSSNPYDLLIGRLADAFSQIPNFELVRSDSDANKLFNMITFRISDISAYRELVIHHYVPATNAAIAKSKQMMRASNFKHLLTVSDEQFQETLYQTMRLSYVGLFHKLESYMNDIIAMSSIFSENEYEETLEKYAQCVFGYRMRDWQQYYATAKINWVCNCEKHYDGFPDKTPKPLTCAHFPEGRRLMLTVQEFKKDVDDVLQFCNTLLSSMFMITKIRDYEKDFNYEFWKDNPEMLASHEATVAQMKKVFQDFIDKLKELNEELLSLG